MNNETDLEVVIGVILEPVEQDAEPANFPQCTEINKRTAHHEISSRCPKRTIPQATVRWSQDGILRYRLERNENRRVRTRGTGAVIETTGWDLSHGKNAKGDISISYKGRVPTDDITGDLAETMDAIPGNPNDKLHKIELKNRSNNYVAFELRVVEKGGDIDILRGTIRHRSKRNFYAWGDTDAAEIALLAAKEEPR